MPDIIIIAGCNGAGKTTVAYNLLKKAQKLLLKMVNYNFSEPGFEF